MPANGRIKAIPGGTFYLRYNRNQWDPLGKDSDAAAAAKRGREISLEGITDARSVRTRLQVKRSFECLPTEAEDSGVTLTTHQS